MEDDFQPDDKLVKLMTEPVHTGVIDQDPVWFSVGYNVPGYAPDPDNLYEFPTFEEAIEQVIAFVDAHNVKNTVVHTRFIKEVWREDKLTPREFEFSIAFVSDFGLVHAYWVQKHWGVMP